MQKSLVGILRLVLQETTLFLHIHSIFLWYEHETIRTEIKVYRNAFFCGERGYYYYTTM